MSASAGTAASPKLKLSEEEVDDLLFFSRAGQLEELQQTLEQLAARLSADEGLTKNVLPQVLEAATSETGNGVLHYCCANGHQGEISQTARAWLACVGLRQE